MRVQQFFAELKRRNIFRVATAYAIAGWLIIQICTATFPYLNLPNWLITAVIVFVGIGFPIALIFAWAFEITPEGLKKSAEVDITQSVTKQTAKKLNGVIIGVLSVALFFVLVERVFFAKASILEDAADQAYFDQTSIAVLPFVNMSNDADNEYFSDGLSEELLNALAKVEDMKVAGRTSSFKFKGQNEDLKLVGEQLGVAHILEGSVRKAGDRIRITAQLVKVDDGFHLWSETYDRELTATNVFEIQEEISRHVLGELKIRLLPEDEAELETVPTRDIEAYQAYLKGNQLLVNRNLDEIVAAVQLYKDALRLDPAFAPAYAQLAIAYNLEGYYGNISFSENRENMKANIDQAFSIDRDLPEAYAALGLYHSTNGEQDLAVEAFERSLELNPNLIDVYNWIGNEFEDLGRIQEQMEMYTLGYEIDPLNPLTIYNRIRVSMDVEDIEEADYYTQKNFQINPDFIPTYFLIGNFQMGEPYGRLDEAIKYYLEVYELDNQFPRASVVLIFTSLILQSDGMADYFYDELKTNYRNSFEFRSTIGYYGRIRSDYDDFENIVLTFLDEEEVIPRDNFTYYDLADYALITGNIDRVLPYFEEFDPNLFSLRPEVNARNDNQASALIPLLQKNGDTEQANRLTETYCEYVEESVSQYPKGIDDSVYRNSRAACSFLKDDMSLLYEDIVFLYYDRKDVPGVNGWLTFVEDFYPEKYTPELQELHDRFRNEMEEQRENIVSYLKENGKWMEEWGEGN